MITKRRIHDGIVGVVLLLSLLLGHLANGYYYWIAVALGVLLLQSAFTCFCPVYFVLDKLIRDQPREKRSVSG